MATKTINAEDYRIPARPADFEKLRSMVKGPADIDAAARQLGLAPRLLNVHLATVLDLSSFGLGRAVHIPVQITDREGGRKSLYFLDVDEEVLAGVYVIDLGIVLRYVKRNSGKGTPATSGDTYSERLANLQGTTLFEAQGPLEVIDPEMGQGTVRLALPDSDIERTSRQWILWSCIYFEEENY